MAKDVRIVPADGTITFNNAAGTGSGQISLSGDDLVFSNAVGDVLFGDTDSDVYIGDGVNNVDVIFEQNGSIRGETGSTVALTLGSNETTLYLTGSTLALQKDGGSVGIGTTSPTSILHIENAGNTFAKFINTSGTNQRLDVGTNSSNQHFVFGYGAYPVLFGSNGTTRMTIESNGEINISGYGTEGAYLNTNGSFRIDFDHDNDHTDRAFIISSNGAASDLFRINENGNVGIGNNAPPQKLTVQGAISASGDIRTSGGYVGGNSNQTRDKLRVWADASYAIGMKSGYTYGHISNDYAMSFQMNDQSTRGFWWGDTGHTDAQGAMALTTNGRLVVAASISVGEGQSITGPSTETLYVNGNATITGTVTAQEFHTEFVSSSIIFTSGSTKFGNSPDDIHNFTGSIIASGSSHTLDAGAYELNILSSGLTVTSQGSTGGDLGGKAATYHFGGAGSTLRVGPQYTADRDYIELVAGGTESKVQASNENLTIDNLDAGGKINLEVAGSTLLMVSASGNVGIGDTTPSYKLDVNGDARVTSHLYSNASMRAPIFYDIDNTAYYLNPSSTSTSAILAGDVGIGTTNPALRLDIVDNSAKGAGIDEALIRLRSTDQYGASIHISGSSNWRLISTGTSSTPGGGDFGFYNDANTAYRMVIQGDGNVGIGTTSPAQPLHVAGNAEIEGNIYLGEYLFHNDDTNTYVRMLGDSIRMNAGGIEFLRLIEDDTQDQFIINEGSVDIDFRVEGNNDINLIRTDAANDKVGIGLETPSAKLHVSGTNDVLLVEGSGSTIFDVQGSQGQLFSVTDSLVGSLFSVNDISGLPILEVFDTDKVVMGTFGSNALVVSGSNVAIGTGSFDRRFTIAENTTYLSIGEKAGYTPSNYGPILETNSGTMVLPTRTYWANSNVWIDKNGTSARFHGDGGILFSYYSGGTITGMKLTNGGNVGVGTTNPQQKLHVSGTLQVHDNTSIYGISIGQHPGFTSYGGLWNSKATSDNGARYMIINAAQADNYITYINGDQVVIRPGQNSTTGQLKITTSGATFSGAVSASAFSGSFVGNGSGLTGISAAAASLEEVLNAGNDAAGLSITNVNALSSTGGNFTGIGLVSASAFEVATNATVRGNLDVGEYVYHTTDSNTYMRFQGDNMQFAAGGLTFLEFSEGSSDLITFNKQGDNVNFLISGSGGTTLYASASGHIGIGTSSPQQKLHIEGNIYMGPNNSNNFVHSGASLGLQADGDIKIVADVNDTSGVGANDIIFGYGSSTNTDSNQDFTEAELGTYPRVEVMRIDGSSNRVGIGTSAPSQSLDVEGNVQAGIFIAENSTLLRRFVPSWGNANLHDVIYNGWNAQEGDYVYLKAQGNGTSNHGAIFVGDNEFQVGRSNIETGGMSSGLDTAWLIVSSSGRVGIGTSVPTEVLSVFPNTDESAEIGRAHVGYVGHSDYAGFSHYDRNNTSDYALLQASNGTTYLNASSGTPIHFRINNSTQMYLSSAGNFGIGTTSTPSKLTVQGDVSASGDLYVTRGTFTNAVEMTGLTVTGTATFTGGVTAPSFTGSLQGNAATATSATSATNADNVNIDSATSGTGYRVMFADSAGTGYERPYVHDNGFEYDPGSGTIRVSGDVVAYNSFSDRELKDNIQTYEGGLNAVMQLNPVTYEWKKGREGQEIGLIAQEVEQVIPQVVREQQRMDEGTYKTVDYEKLVAVLIDAVQDQQRQINELKDTINGITS